METWPAIGLHKCSFEEPDIIFMELIGHVSAEEGTEINRRHRVMGEGKDYVFFLIDLAELDSIHPDVRKEAGTVLKNLPVRGAFAYGAPLKAKVIAKLIFTAMNMFKSAADKITVDFFDTQDEARAAVSRRRDGLLLLRRPA
ncbi:MAG TPA: hypothetical protein VHU81_10190 [Thermoanaerobaculia bacterium]|jgi:hypothetical protein|nr:hypothetical protein [Thermoanaerobaculia bacterium]